MNLVRNKNKGLVKEEFNLSGYTMPSKKGFSIDGELINNINITNKKLYSPIVTKVVRKRFNKLIEELTELLVSDDEDGSNYREALDKIEKFRLIIKNKYREFLTRKELEKMSIKLKLLQKEAFKKLLIINDVNMIGKNNYRGGK